MSNMSRTNYIFSHSLEFQLAVLERRYTKLSTRLGRHGRKAHILSQIGRVKRLIANPELRFERKRHDYTIVDSGTLSLMQHTCSGESRADRRQSRMLQESCTTVRSATYNQMEGAQDSIRYVLPFRTEEPIRSVLRPWYKYTHKKLQDKRKA